MRRRMNHLFIGTKSDLASINIAKHFIQDHQWKHIPTEQILQANAMNSGLAINGFPSYSITNNQLFFYYQQQKRKDGLLPHDRLFFWIVDHSLLALNYPNIHFKHYLSKFFFPETPSTPFIEDHRRNSHILSPEDLAIDNVFFVSRHSAASGTVSLTVHPIGIPHLKEVGRNGGIAGRCSPPNPHIANLYRSILQETKLAGLDSLFTITLEATHHGPFVEIPTCFIEIGSTMAQWQNPEAGMIWSRCLGHYFGLKPRTNPEERQLIDELFKDFEQFLKLEEDSGSDSEEEAQDEEVSKSEKRETKAAEVAPEPLEANPADIHLKSEAIPETNIEEEEESTLSPCQLLDISKGVAILVIGGGHYVPRMNDMARFGENYHVAHCLASYTLEKHQFEEEVGGDFIYPNPSNPLPQSWKRILYEAIQSSRISYPDCRLVCLIDKKSFNNEEKQKITSVLEAEQIAWSHKTSDIRKFAGEK